MRFSGGEAVRRDRLFSEILISLFLVWPFSWPEHYPDSGFPSSGFPHQFIIILHMENVAIDARAFSESHPMACSTLRDYLVPYFPIATLQAPP
jgi:hypothetical protein